MFLRLSTVFSLYDRYGYNNENSTLSTIEQNLRSHPSYIGTVPSRRFTWEEIVEESRADYDLTTVRLQRTKSTSTSAIIIDYDKFKEAYNIDFKRDIGSDNQDSNTESNSDSDKNTKEEDLPF